MLACNHHPPTLYHQMNPQGIPKLQLIINKQNKESTIIHSQIPQANQTQSNNPEIRGCKQGEG